MPIPDPAPGSKSIGYALGKAVGKIAKPKAKASRSTGRRSSSRRSSGGGGGSRRSSGGGGGYSENNPYRPGNTGVKAGNGRATQPIPKNQTNIPSIADYLGTDAVYQGVLSSGKRSLADYLSELGRRRGEATTQYTQTRASMERDRQQQLEDLKNEYASRGLIQSGVYGEEQGKFQNQFNQQMQTLSQQQAALLADLLSQEKNYRREQQSAYEAAKQEALQRRAAKFKIGA